MGSLVFSREKVGGQVLITGVKRPDDDLFHKILGDHQRLAWHPICLKHKLEKCRGRRTTAIKLSEPEYKVYFNEGQFAFRGTPLQTGKCLSSSVPFELFQINLSISCFAFLSNLLSFPSLIARILLARLQPDRHPDRRSGVSPSRPYTSHRHHTAQQPHLRSPSFEPGEIHRFI